MRRLVSAAAAIALVASISASAFAFTSLNKYTNSATVTFGAGTVNLSLTLKRLDNNNTTNQVFWDPSGVNIGVTKWRRADAYIVLSTTMTDSAGAVQIYTDNKGAGASPAYTGTGDCSGLVCAQDTTQALKMAWRATDISTNTLSIQNTTDYANLYVSELSPTNYVFSYLNDPSSGLGMGDSYAQVKTYSQGNHLASGGTGQLWSYVPNINQTYLYLGANFNSALSSRSYSTNKLIVETYLQ